MRRPEASSVGGTPSRLEDGISVVMAVLDAARFLAAALDSVQAQTVPVGEILLVDGGSTDGTLEIARQRGDVRIIPQTGRGIADAYNLGVSEAAHPFVAFLSGDDRWTARKIEIQREWLRTHPEHLFVTGWARFELEPGHSLPRGFRPELIGAERPASIMETLLARREAFDRVGPFDVQHPVAEDVDWFARARDAGVPSGIVPEVVVHKRIHDRNASTNAARNTRELLSVVRRAAQRKREAGP